MTAQQMLYVSENTRDGRSDEYKALYAKFIETIQDHAKLGYTLINRKNLPEGAFSPEVLETVYEQLAADGYTVNNLWVGWRTPTV